MTWTQQEFKRRQGTWEEQEQEDFEDTLTCPSCGYEASIDEWRLDAWRCRGCAEYLPYEIRSKYFESVKEQGGVFTICENCGYVFTDEELADLIVRRTGAIICPECGNVVYIDEI